MSAPALPYGAAEILALRKAGKRPADLVIISMIGPLREVNPVIVANPMRTYDWKFLVDLSVMVVVNSDTPTNAVHSAIEAIRALPARSLSLWLADRQNGQHVIVGGVPARPQGLLRYMDAADRCNYAGIGINKDYHACK